MSLRALIGANVFDGLTLHHGAALLLDGHLFHSIAAPGALPDGARIEEVEGGTLTPGFVDLQVNGGGGAMFNDAPSVETLTIIAEAHASTGTRALLPTLITDTPEHTHAAIAASEAAIARGIPGIVGLHLEGPHLSPAKAGAHDPTLIRPMTADDEALLIDAAARLPNLMVTLAPEAVSPPQIARLAKAGVIVSLGHSACTLEQAQAAASAGAKCVTHLFNAMSQLGSRAPGLVGAALDAGSLSAGLIADGHHVDPASIRVALAAKRAPGRLFLVTDAMATAGSDISSFALNGREIRRADGTLTLEDGTLAGADLDMPGALRVMTEQVGATLETALGMATGIPASLLRSPGAFGRFVPGKPAHAIRLDTEVRYTDSRSDGRLNTS